MKGGISMNAKLCEARNKFKTKKNKQKLHNARL